MYLTFTSQRDCVCCTGTKVWQFSSKFVSVKGYKYYYLYYANRQLFQPYCSISCTHTLWRLINAKIKWPGRWGGAMPRRCGGPGSPAPRRWTRTSPCWGPCRRRRGWWATRGSASSAALWICRRSRPLDVIPEGAILRYDEHALLPVEGQVAGVEDGEQCAEMGRRYQHLKRKENIFYYVYAAYCIYMHKMWNNTR